MVDTLLWDMQCTDDAVWNPSPRPIELHCWHWPAQLIDPTERLLAAIGLLRSECDLLEQLIWRKPRGCFRLHVKLLAKSVRTRLWPRWPLSIRECAELMCKQFPDGILMDGKENPQGDSPIKPEQELWLYIPLAQLFRALESVGHWQEQFRWVTVKCS